MKKITDKEYTYYHRYLNDNRYGRVLTPDGLRLICEAFDNNPEKIGIHMLETLNRFRVNGVIK